MPEYEKDVANVNKIKESQMAFKLFTGNLLLNFNITAHLQVHNTVPYFKSKSDTKEKIQSILYKWAYLLAQHNTRLFFSISQLGIINHNLSSGNPIKRSYIQAHTHTRACTHTHTRAHARTRARAHAPTQLHTQSESQLLYFI